MERAHAEAMGDDITLPERPHRRSFTATYKLAVLTEYDSAEALESALSGLISAATARTCVPFARCCLLD